MHSLNNTRSSLFLIELIIAILFFSLGAAVCVQAFVKAHTTSMEARDLSFASSACSSAANVVEYTDGSLEAVQGFYPTAYAEGEDIAVCYDSHFEPCSDAANAAYVLRIDAAREGLARRAHIHVDSAAGETLYELQLRWPGEVSHG